MNLPLNIDWQQILLHLFNFVILGGGLYLLLYRPIKKFMDKRIEGYREMDEKAEAKLKEAKELKEKYETEMAEADHQIAEKKKEADAAMQKAKDLEAADAKAKAEAIIVKARKEADLERERILHDTQRQIRGMVEEATEKLVKKSVHDVYEEFLATEQRKEEQGA